METYLELYSPEDKCKMLLREILCPSEFKEKITSKRKVILIILLAAYDIRKLKHPGKRLDQLCSHFHDEVNFFKTLVSA